MIHQTARANSCCGQAPTSFMVLQQQQRLAVSPSVSSTRTVGRVFNSPDFHVWDSSKKRTIETVQINAAAALADHHQMFLTAGLLRGSYREETFRGQSTHASDTLLGYTYEALPEYTYSPWKPVIYVSALLNVPTGNSIYDDAELSEGAEVSGHNQWGAGLGLTARKVIFPWTMVVQARAIRLIEKDFSSVSVSGFYDASLAAFVTYATRLWDLSFTGGLTWNTLGSRRLSTMSSNSARSEVTTLVASLQKPINDSFVVSLAYADQTLWGDPRNTLLNQTVTFNVTYNFF